MKKDGILLTFGIFCLTYWVLDFINIVFLIHKPEFLLWYSNAGLLLTSIAILLRKRVLISIMFCALFVMESVWVLDFLAEGFFHSNFLGITNYLFDPTFGKKDFVMSMYHLLIPTALLYSILKTKEVFRYSWVGALIYASILSLLTFFLADLSDNVNCIHQLSRCRGALSFVFTIAPYPYYILTVLAFATIFVFIPTNYVLIKIARKYNWKVS